MNFIIFRYSNMIIPVFFISEVFYRIIVKDILIFQIESPALAGRKEEMNPLFGNRFN